MASDRGRIPRSTRLPSRGGIGSRLNAASQMFSMRAFLRFSNTQGRAVSGITMVVYMRRAAA